MTIRTIIILFLIHSFSQAEISFNQDIRPLFSNSCFHCHGPDEETREAGMRLDTFAGATAINDGIQSIVPGDPDASEVMKRLRTHDQDKIMPPVKHGKPFSAEAIATIKQWIKEGAKYETHWAYVKPKKRDLPSVVKAPVAWRNHPIDAFIYKRLAENGYNPSNEADRRTLARRVALDLTGIPPTVQEVEAFLNDSSPKAYEAYVDKLLAKPSYGEHWTRMWLDLARYADSAGYADDRPRTIWSYRDYVIRSFNENKPFDQFSTEQLAGDLLPNPTASQLIATAFHRNTQTNSEGGTNDEEFRNVAVVDRVNTTMATWMGTTMACAQCHTHKYDPITHEEYFQVFDIFNQTKDSDRQDEFPTLPLFTGGDLAKKDELVKQIATLEKNNATRKIVPADYQRWEQKLKLKKTKWQHFIPSALDTQAGATLVSQPDHSILATGNAGEFENYTLTGIIDPAQTASITALKIELLTDPSLPKNGPGRAGNGNLVLSDLTLTSSSKTTPRSQARYVRIDLPGKNRMLALAEVQIFSNGVNIAPKGKASQSSNYKPDQGLAQLAVDGNTNGKYAKKSVTHTGVNQPVTWWEVDLKEASLIDNIVVWNRVDGKPHHLDRFKITVLDAQRKPIWTKQFAKAPKISVSTAVNNAVTADFDLAGATASHSERDSHVSKAVDRDSSAKSGWAISGGIGKSQQAIFPLVTPLPAGQISLSLLQNYSRHTIGKFRISYTSDPSPESVIPDDVKLILNTPLAQRTAQQTKAIEQYYFLSNTKFANERKLLTELKRQLNNLKPNTTVPVMASRPKKDRRDTHVHLRGSYLSHGPQVHAGFPEAFTPEGYKSANKTPNRLDLAQWIFHEDNALTSRVTANRFWENIFGIGLVATSEEFGSQGEAPTHPELLDWLAIEIRESGWDVKKFLKLIVTSAAYKQSSHVTADLHRRDPANRYLARGPRVRLSAEMVRDQALAVSGLLSDKMFGHPVNPPQPNLGLKAAFGGAIDWKTSRGEDKFRRGIYTTWRRSNPYPSMATFDAPNREVCTVRRGITNTPLQALVTLNDPVFVEAAQALARRTIAQVKDSNNTEKQLKYAFSVSLFRDPTENELKRLTQLYDESFKTYQADKEQAKKMATVPIGAAPANTNISHLAALTVVSNVILNLDELLMKR